MITRAARSRRLLAAVARVQVGSRFLAATPAAFGPRSPERKAKAGDERSGKFSLVHDSPASRPDAPLVVLIGFGGASESVMAKYSDVYAGQGYSRARFAPELPKQNSLVGYRPHSRLLFDRLHEECAELERRPVVFHLFSQTGVRQFVALWDLIAQTPDSRLRKEQVRGIVWDSCPADVRPHHVALAVARIVHPLHRSSRIPHLATYLGMAAWLHAHRFGILLQALRDPRAKSRHFAFHRLHELDDFPRRQLFLYTDKDDLCNPQETRQFAEFQRQRGVDVREQNWPVSSHCQHLLNHKEEYTRVCLEFARSTFE
ncbi:Transmembrane protein 53 [Aphelenchoides fujianensis]|nr:Transmembrane protein 53 [Aphelenchoides fujianensis]